jgi:hypothetical protein
MDDPSADWMPHAPRFAIVAVKELPWPWNPFRCLFHPGFEAQLAGAGADIGGRSQAFGAYVQRLSKDCLGACPYHATDWRLAAAVAVELLELSLADDRDELARRVRALGGRDAEIDATTSLFRDPIAWRPGADSVRNGQHRTCALKTCGVRSCIVDTS